MVRSSRAPAGAFAVGQRVAFTEKWLVSLQPAEAQRLRGRVGTVTGYRLGASDPIVVFPATPRLKELRFFEVPPSRLEMVGAQGLVQEVTPSE